MACFLTHGNNCCRFMKCLKPLKAAPLCFHIYTEVDTYSKIEIENRYTLFWFTNQPISSLNSVLKSNIYAKMI